MTHYGEANHSAKKFFIEGVVMGSVSAGAPFLVGLSTPWTHFFLVLTILIILWFGVYAFGALLTYGADKQLFHQQRILVHLATLIAAGISLLIAQSELNVEVMPVFLCLFMIVVVYPSVPIVSHILHHKRNTHAHELAGSSITMANSSSGYASSAIAET